ncbi:hypothetical protein [Teichococcus vastitatis]|jgi:hypothetical protein|uniref:Winged helix-turn helix n=1 Tax=Teichococcus vastitatis TaxID=2307076 RepID=A0ABS9W862_9PROT|nr:hypothetical protein [Pseudoroseomonas vastitatis]MCI0755480.1 hypothetical protein [Pseudoroseomonas vastitatis]
MRLGPVPGADPPEPASRAFRLAGRATRCHRGNVDVVRQKLASELGIVVSLRTVVRAVSHL